MTATKSAASPRSYRLAILKISKLYGKDFLMPSLQTLIRLFAVFAFSVGVVQAQSITSTITGVVTDGTGAVVPGANVTVTNNATGVVVNVSTNDEGVFNAPTLRPDAYTMQVQLQGFKTATREVVLPAAQTLRLDFALETGDVAETVLVESSTAPLLSRETAEIGTSISAQEVANLPLKDRSPYGALLLVPGYESASEDPSGANSGTLSFNGSRALNTQVSIDGINLSSVTGIGERVASVDSLQEVKVLTSNFSAEYGQTQGGSILFQVKSGGRRFNGSLYSFHNNSAFNAADWQSNAQGIVPAKDQRTDFGGSLGGPVYLPRFGEGGPATIRDKAFFFVSYEGTSSRDAINRISTIPDVALRNGDFSGLRGASGAPLVYLRDPLKTGTCSATSQVACFSDGGVLNRIPQNRLDPAALRITQRLPAPNATGTTPNAVGIRSNNYILSGANKERQNFLVMRYDITPTTNDKISFTYRLIKEDQTERAVSFQNALNTQTGNRTRTIHSGALNYNRVFSPSVSNEFLLTLARDNRVIAPDYVDFDLATTFDIRRGVGRGLPRIDLGTYSDYGDSLFNDGINQQLAVQNITSVLRGRHTFRFGPQLYQHQEPYAFNDGQTAGTYVFTGAITGNGTQNGITSLADFLIGAVRNASAPAQQPANNRVNYDLGFFVQDDFKVSPNLTLNLGLRYEFETLPISRVDVFSRVDPQTGQLLVAGRNATRNLDRNPDYLNFSPRVGLAYSFREKTVIRSGFGIVHGTTYQDYGPRQLYTGFSFNTTYLAVGTTQAQPFTLSQGFDLSNRSGIADPLALFNAATAANPLPVSGPTFIADDRRPYVMQYQISVQREVGFGTVVDIAYVGNTGVRLARVVPGNNPTLDVAQSLNGGAVPQARRPFPRLGAFNVYNYDAGSNYNSLQAKLARRFAQGLSLQSTYVFSKNMDDASNGFGRGAISDAQLSFQFPQSERALSDIDRKHKFTAGVVYDLPFGNGRRFLDGSFLGAIVGGFQLNALVNAGTGRPFTILQGRVNQVLIAQRPNLVGTNQSGQVAEPFIDPNVRGAYRYLIPVGDSDFPFAPSGVAGIGNLSRNTARVPGYRNVNLSLFRDFSFTERVRLQARIEAFNAFNNVNFGEPDSEIETTTVLNADGTRSTQFTTGGGYGLVTEARPARVIQLGLRLRF